MNSLCVFAGAGIGATLRYWIGAWYSARPNNGFPLHTLFINVSGSLLIGVFIAFADRYNWSPATRLFFATGVLGGYTTFSTFSLETVTLYGSGRLAAAAGYAASSLVLCVLAAAAGVKLAALVPGA